MRLNRITINRMLCILIFTIFHNVRNLSLLHDKQYNYVISNVINNTY